MRISAGGSFGVSNICVSADGSVYICGGCASGSILFFRWSSTIGTTINTGLIAFTVSPGFPVSFIAKYDPTGNFVFGNTIWNQTGPFSLQDPMGLVTDSANNVYVTGAYSGNLFVNNFLFISAFQIVTSVYGTLTNGGGTAKNTYVIKYDSGGTVQWSTRLWNTSIAGPGSATVDASDNLYISGVYDSALTIDNFVSGGGGGAIVTTPYASMTTQSGNDTYSLVKYTPAGSAVWATNGTAPGSTSTDLTFAKCDANNAVYFSTAYAAPLPVINKYVSTTAGTVNTNVYNTLMMVGSYFNGMLVKYAI
jgi:hypothetical protein